MALGLDFLNKAWKAQNGNWKIKPNSNSQQIWPTNAEEIPRTGKPRNRKQTKNVSPANKMKEQRLFYHANTTPTAMTVSRSWELKSVIPVELLLLMWLKFLKFEILD